MRSRWDRDVRNATRITDPRATPAHTADTFTVTHPVATVALLIDVSRRQRTFFPLVAHPALPDIEVRTLSAIRFEARESSPRVHESGVEIGG